MDHLPFSICEFVIKGYTKMPWVWVFRVLKSYKKTHRVCGHISVIMDHGLAFMSMFLIVTKKRDTKMVFSFLLTLVIMQRVPRMGHCSIIIIINFFKDFIYGSFFNYWSHLNLNNRLVCLDWGNCFEGASLFTKKTHKLICKAFYVYFGVWMNSFLM